MCHSDVDVAVAVAVVVVVDVIVGSGGSGGVSVAVIKIKNVRRAGSFSRDRVPPRRATQDNGNHHFQVLAVHIYGISSIRT